MSKKNVKYFHSVSLFTRVYICKSDWRPLKGQCQHHCCAVNTERSSSVTIADALKCRHIHGSSGTVWSGRFLLANTSCSLILCEWGCGTTQINRTAGKYWYRVSVSLLTDSEFLLSNDRSSMSGIYTFIYFYCYFRSYRWHFSGNSYYSGINSNRKSYSI